MSLHCNEKSNYLLVVWWIAKKVHKHGECQNSASTLCHFDYIKVYCNHYIMRSFVVTVIVAHCTDCSYKILSELHSDCFYV